MRANYEVVGFRADLMEVLIRDVGPWDRFITVTNDAENVVRDLIVKGMLPEGARLYYYDSEGELGEIVVMDGEFARFAPVQEQ